MSCYFMQKLETVGYSEITNARLLETIENCVYALFLTQGIHIFQDADTIKNIINF